MHKKNTRIVVNISQKTGLSIFHFTQLPVFFCNSSLATLYHTPPRISRLIPFTSMSVPPDVPLNLLEVLAVSDLPNHSPEHIRQIPTDQIAALYVMATHFTAVEPWTACARWMRVHRTYSRTVLTISAFPIITRQDDTPYILRYQDETTNAEHVHTCYEYTHTSPPSPPE